MEPFNAVYWNMLTDDEDLEIQEFYYANGWQVSKPMKYGERSNETVFYYNRVFRNICDNGCFSFYSKQFKMNEFDTEN